MENGNRPLRTIWLEDERTVGIIDQRRLPHEFVTLKLTESSQCVAAIKEMAVRGAPLIGATAAYGAWLASKEAKAASKPDEYFAQAMEALRQSRPTAVNLFWALKRQEKAIEGLNDWQEKAEALLRSANALVEEDVATCSAIGDHGLKIIEEIHARTNKAVNVLTHCNAGMLGCVEWGTATAPFYKAKAADIPVHVWVDETRPRNQGASLTAWELTKHGVAHTLVVDNAGGHLMQHGLVDMCIVGTDRTTRTGDVANKIGTYLKALAAHDNDVPFYVALPSTTIDWEISDGVQEIPIEERSADEVKYMTGLAENGKIERVLITPQTTPASNYGFDVTPARLITGLVTERGTCPATEKGLLTLYPEKVQTAMRNTLLTVLPMLALLGCGAPQSQEKDTAAETEARTPTTWAQMQLDAYNGSDLEGFLDCYLDSVRIYDFPSKLTMEGLSTMRERYDFVKSGRVQARLENRIALGKVVFDHEEVSVEGQPAPFYAVAAYKIEPEGIAEARFLGRDTADIANVEAVVQSQVQAFSDRDLEAFLAPYADSVQVYRYPDERYLDGKTAMRAFYQERFAQAEGLNCEVVNRIVCGSMVVDLEVITTAAKPDPRKAVAIYRVQDGQIVELWHLSE